MVLYDLHTHSVRSDGCLPPAEIVREAAAAGLSALALTDHDTAEGCAEAAAEAARLGLRFFPGVEISAEEPPGVDKLHILGLNTDPGDPALNAALDKCTSARFERTFRICEYLGSRGLRLDAGRINASAGGNVGKPHIALEMIRCGYAGSVREAFDRYLSDPAIDRIKKYKLPLEEALSLIHGAGGLAVLAHPSQLRNDGRECLDEHIAAFREMGLDGIECYYSTHTRPQAEHYISVAERYGLYISCGSDFHGEAVKPDISLGTGRDGSLTDLRENCPSPERLSILTKLGT